jgi:predicted MFS family arabinose efflux permease
LPPRARAGIYGLRSAAWNLGFAAASFIAGKIIVRSGYEPTFIAICISTAAAGFLFFAYYRRHPAVLAGQVPSALPKAKLPALAQRNATPELDVT